MAQNFQIPSSSWSQWAHFISLLIYPYSSCHSRRACNCLCRLSLRKASGNAIEKPRNLELRISDQYSYKYPIHPRHPANSKMLSPNYAAYPSTIRDTVAGTKTSSCAWAQGEWCALDNAVIWPVVRARAEHILAPVSSGIDVHTNSSEFRLSSWLAAGYVRFSLTGLRIRSFEVIIASSRCSMLGARIN